MAKTLASGSMLQCCAILILVLAIATPLMAAKNEPISILPIRRLYLPPNQIPATDDLKALTGQQREGRLQGAKQFDSALSPTIPMPVNLMIVEMSVGTPAQPLQLAVDTASCDLKFINPSTCTNCEKNGYQPSMSSTSFEHTCSPPLFSCICDTDSYFCDGTDPNAKCSLSGREYSDNFNLASFTVPTSICSLGSVSPDYRTYHLSGGTLGLACGDGGHLMDRLDPKINFRFGYCMDATNDHPHGREGGLLMLGGVPSHYVTSEFVTTTLLGYEPGNLAYKRSTYYVNLTDISIGNIAIGVNPSDYGMQFFTGTLVDSTSPVFRLNVPSFQAFKAILQSTCRNSALPGLCPSSSATLFDGACFPMSESQRDKFPPLTLHFNNNGTIVKLPIQPSEYLYQREEGSGTYCLAIGEAAPLTEFNKVYKTSSIASRLGSLVLSRFTLLFDRKQGTLGFARTNPDTCKKPAN